MNTLLDHVQKHSSQNIDLIVENFHEWSLFCSNYVNQKKPINDKLLAVTTLTIHRLIFLCGIELDRPWSRYDIIKSRIINEYKSGDTQLATLKAQISDLEQKNRMLKESLKDHRSERRNQGFVTKMFVK